MALNSAVVAAGDTVTATERNNLRKDILTHNSDTLTDTGAVNAYIVTVDNQITSLVTGQVVKFVVGVTNTGASTLRFKNSLALDITDAIKSPTGGAVVAGDLTAGAVVYLVFNGTDWQLFISGLSKASQAQAEAATDDVNYMTALKTKYQLKKLPAAIPTITIYTSTDRRLGDSSTQFDITNPVGTTARYTYDGTGTNPNISLVTFPIGTIINFRGQNFNAANKIQATITGAGANYLEITNAAVVAETNKTIGTGFVSIVQRYVGTYTKNALTSFVRIRESGGGAAGWGAAGGDDAGAGGGAGGYSEKIIAAASLGATETITLGYGGDVIDKSTAYGGGVSSFGAHCSANGGSAGATRYIGGVGGTATSGDLNITGSDGGDVEYSYSGASTRYGGGFGGGNPLSGTVRGGTYSDDSAGTDGRLYGGGGGGGSSDSGGSNGGKGGNGVIIIEEYFAITA